MRTPQFPHAEELARLLAGGRLDFRCGRLLSQVRRFEIRLGPHRKRADERDRLITGR